MGNNSWDIYLRRLNLNGNSQKDRFITNTQRTITNNFSNSPSYYEVTINDVYQEVQIVDESALNKNANKKRLLCKPDESISIGDEVVWNYVNWICTESEDTQVYIRGIIEKCDSNLKYLSSSGVIVTVPCIIKDRILMGSDENNYYILPNNSIWVTVGSNSDSIPIFVDQRFILSGNVYKIESINNITQPGLINFKMSFDSINEDDNETLSIANYYSNSHTYSITILNNADSDITLGQTLQLESECLDNYEVQTSPTIFYSLLTGSTGIITVSSGGLISTIALGSGSVKATYASSATDTIGIDVIAGAITNYTYSLIGNIQPDSEIKYNQTKTYTAIKRYNTGTQVTGSKFVFTVTGSATSNYILTTSSDTTCTLKCLEYPNDISLIATDNDIPANTVAKVISLKGLI